MLAARDPAAAGAGRSRTGGHPHLSGTAQRADRHGRSERGLPRRDPQIHLQVVTLPAKARMRPETHQEVEIARWGLTATRRALAGDADALAFTHPGRDLDLEAPLTIKREASPSSRQGLLERELEYRLAIAPAEWSAVGRTSALAEQALKEVGVAALAEFDADIGAKSGASEEILEVGHVWSLSARTSLIAQTVVPLALLGIGEDLVRLPHLLEALLGVAVLIDVRVVLASELSVRAANVV